MRYFVPWYLRVSVRVCPLMVVVVVIVVVLTLTLSCGQAIPKLWVVCPQNGAAVFALEG